MVRWFPSERISIHEPCGVSLVRKIRNAIPMSRLSHLCPRAIRKLCIGTFMGVTIGAGCAMDAKQSHAGSAGVSFERLCDDYSNAKDDVAKRDVALRSIDEGFVGPNANLDMAKRLFQGDLVTNPSYVDESRAMPYAIVNFAAPTPSSPSSVGTFRGWYMILFLQDDRSEAASVMASSMLRRAPSGWRSSRCGGRRRVRVS